MATYSFQRLPGKPEGWDDLISEYHTKTLFHESAWLDHVQSIHPDGDLRFYEILEGSRRIGLHVGLEITKFGLRIHGSPLGGTGTNFMGPLVNRDVEPEALAEGLGGILSAVGVQHLEVSHFRFDPKLMEAKGFRTHEDVTHLVPLHEGRDAAWAGLKGTGRNRVRKAEKNGLTVEQVPGADLVDEFYAQFTEVYGKQGMDTPFGPERVRSLAEHLGPAGRVLVLAVKKDEDIVATGYFPFDEKCIYFWGAASWRKFQKWSPNELLHWKVMEFATDRGIEAYNMCGGQSRFKDKFGGEDVPYLHFSRSALPGLGLARKAYRSFHFWSLKKGSDGESEGS